MKLLEIKWNWKYLSMTFSMSFPMVLRRTMSLKDLGKSYDSLLDLGMTMNIEVLKWEDQWPSSKHTSAILMILLRHPLFLIILLRYLYNSLFRLGVNELLHLAMELVNFSSKKGTYIVGCLFGISSNVQTSICWS